MLNNLLSPAIAGGAVGTKPETMEKLTHHEAQKATKPGKHIGTEAGTTAHRATELLVTDDSAVTVDIADAAAKEATDAVNTIAAVSANVAPASANTNGGVRTVDVDADDHTHGDIYDDPGIFVEDLKNLLSVKATVKSHKCPNGHVFVYTEGHPMLSNGDPHCPACLLQARDVLLERINRNKVALSRPDQAPLQRHVPASAEGLNALAEAYQKQHQENQRRGKQ